MSFVSPRPSGPAHTNPFSNENGAVLLRIRLSSTLQRRKRSPKTELFENALQSGAVWKQCFMKTLFSSVDGENDVIWKRWRHQIYTTRHQTTRPWVPKRLLFSFNPAKAPLRFHKKETRYFKASDLASFRKSEDKMTLSKPTSCFRFWLLSSCSWHRLELRKISKNSKPQQHSTTENQE